MNDTGFSKINRPLLSLLILAIWINHQSLSAQQIPLGKVDTTTVVIEENQSDPLGRSNPRGTMDGLLASLADENYLKASQYLDLSTIQEQQSDSLRSLLVQKLELVLNRNGTIMPIRVISKREEGDQDDGLDPAFEQVGSLDLNGKTVPVLLEWRASTNDQKIWLFSSRTLEAVNQFVAANSESVNIETDSGNIFSTRLRGAPLFEWLAMVFMAIGAYLLAWFFTILISFGVKAAWPTFKTSKYRRFLKTLLIPLRLVLAVVLLLNLSRVLGISIIVRQAFGVVNLIALWMALFIFIWLLIDTLTSLGEERLRARNMFGSLSFISFFRNTTKFILVAAALLIALDNLGVNVTAGLAALGIGGIALALGAQKTIENIVGGLSVVFDQPVSVGDFCKFGDTIGTVEKIGMFSTRIRTLSRTVVTIPNADFSTRLIENYAKRDMFWYHTTLGLRYETTSDQMRYILVELRKILYAHPKVDPEPARVRFLGYGDDSLKVELFAYTHAADWNDFLGIQEDINLRLAKVIEDSGSGFAFPSQTLYLSRDKGLSQEKRERAEARVKEWIENNELQLPEFDSKTIDELRGRINYPDPGRHS